MRLKRTLHTLLLVIFTLLLPVVSFPAAAVPVENFKDISPNAWYCDAVRYAVENDLFKGTSETTFSPNTAMDRGMFVTVLSRQAKFEASQYQSYRFHDVNPGMYHAASVEWAARYGIVTGTGKKTFSPTQKVTREQMATFLYRYAKATGNDTSYTRAAYNAFSDTDKVSSFAVEAMQWATDKKIIKGSNGKLNPKGTASRAQVAQVFQNSQDILVNTEMVIEPQLPEDGPKAPDKVNSFETYQYVLEKSDLSWYSGNLEELLTGENPHVPPVPNLKIEAFSPCLDQNDNFYFWGKLILDYKESPEYASNIFRLDVNTGDLTSLLDVNAATDTDESGNTYEDFQVNQVFWDSASSRLLVDGTYKTVKDQEGWVQPGREYNGIFTIENGALKLAFENLFPLALVPHHFRPGDIEVAEYQQIECSLGNSNYGELYLCRYEARDSDPYYCITNFSDYRSEPFRTEDFDPLKFGIYDGEIYAMSSYYGFYGFNNLYHISRYNEETCTVQRVSGESYYGHPTAFQNGCFYFYNESTQGLEIIRVTDGMTRTVLDNIPNLTIALQHMLPTKSGCYFYTDRYGRSSDYFYFTDMGFIKPTS